MNDNLTRLPCIYWWSDGSIGFEPKCLGMQAVTKEGRMENRVCADVRREGKCPKKKKVLATD
jgi:hypothetical protein